MTTPTTPSTPSFTHFTSRTGTLWCLGILPALLLVGCTNRLNDRIELGNAFILPAFTEAQPAVPDSGPSITTLDRSAAWSPMEFSVPVHGVAHPPIYTKPSNSLDTLPRQRGEYPTALTALDLGEPSMEKEILQTGRAHGMAALEAILLIPRLIMRPPWETDWSPAWNYQRVASEATAVPEADESESPIQPDDSEDFIPDARPLGSAEGLSR